jgi:release factor glutamine methyltransferase
VNVRFGVGEDRGLIVREAFSRGRRFLEERGISQAGEEIQLLLQEITGLSRTGLYLEGDRSLRREEEGVLKGWLERRACHEPLQYILQRQFFWEDEFLVTAGVFIPRPETELLVAEVLKLQREPEVSVDLCTGSGCLAVSLARSFPKMNLHAVDLSKRALSVAWENAKRCGVDDRITFLEGDLFAPLKGLGLEGRVDRVVANPPYIATRDYWSLPPEVRDYEPSLALLGGINGMETIERIVREVGDFLRSGGFLIMEIGYGQGERIREILEKAKGGLLLERMVRDLAGIERVVCLRRE